MTENQQKIAQVNKHLSKMFQYPQTNVLSWNLVLIGHLKTMQKLIEEELGDPNDN